MNLYYNYGKGQGRYPATPLQGAYVIRISDLDNNTLLYLGQVPGERISIWTKDRKLAIRFNQMGHQNTHLVLHTTLMELYNSGLDDLKQKVRDLYPDISIVKLASYSISEDQNYQALQIEI